MRSNQLSYAALKMALFSAKHSANDLTPYRKRLLLNDLRNHHRHYEERGAKRELASFLLLRAHTEGGGTSPKVTEHSATSSAAPTSLKSILFRLIEKLEDERK